VVNSLRIWQIAFLIGLSAFLLGSIFVLGSALFVAVVGVLGITVTIVSQLLSSPRSHNNWPVSTAKAFLNVPPFLKGATIIVWLVTLSIWSYVGFAGYRAYRDRQKVTLEGIVLSARGNPVDKATVVLLLKGGYLETISSNGKFSFAKTDLSGEDTRQLKIHARLGSKEGEVEIDLSKGVPKNILIKLSPGDPPFRITYFVLERHAIDFLLQGKMDSQWEEKLAGQPFIVPNEVYDSLSRLIKSFSSELPEMSDFGFYKVERGVRSNQQSMPTDKGIKSYFVGSYDGADVDLTGIPELLNTITSDQQWKLFLAPTLKQELPYPLIFRKFVNRSELSLLSNRPIGKFYSYITREYMPEDFGYLEVYLSGVCGDDPPWSAYARYVGRSLSLRIAVVENIANEPIRIGKFAIKENDDGSVYTQEENKARLAKKELRHEALFPMEMLKPGEKMVIPIEMRLAGGKQERSAGPVVAANDQYLYDKIRTRGQWNFGEISIPSTVLEMMLSRSTQMVALDREYLLGPSIMVESLEVDNVEFPFRQFDPSKIVIFDEMDSGSCPYVYTYSPQDKTWRNEGVILRGKIGKQRESLDEKVLTRFDGRILIKERDQEDSFIDSVFLRVIYDNGDETIVCPSNKLLCSVDGNRSRLRQGEKLSLFFDVPKRGNVQKYVLSAVGYYVPYRQPNSSSAHLPK
jgi:hypothetical protein